MPEIVNSGEHLLKVCPKCSKSLPATTEHFYRRTRSNGRSYLSSGCKACIRRERESYRADNPEKTRETNNRSRAKHVDKYNEQRRRRFASDPILRQERSAKSRDWYRKNHDYVLLYRKAYVAENNEKTKESDRQSRIKNPDRCRANRVNRKARVRSAPGRLAKADIQHQYNRQDGLCYWCGTNLKDSIYHVDHFIPIAKGGTNQPCNIVIACQTCNSSKGAKMPDEFIAHIKFVEQNKDIIDKQRARMRESMRMRRAKKPGQCRA